MKRPLKLVSTILTGKKKREIENKSKGNTGNSVFGQEVLSHYSLTNV